MALTYLDIFQGDDGRWYWHAKARNGEIIASSEGYVSWSNARRGAYRAFPQGQLR